jgi:uncharacterized coiled-coil DUF342 family protein
VFLTLIYRYYRDQKSSSEKYENIKKYLDKSSQVLKRFQKSDVATTEKAEIRRLKDEQMVLENMIYRMRNEIQTTKDDFSVRTKRLEKIKKLSASQKVDLLQYYNEIEGLCSKIDRAKTISGDISKDLQNISKSCQGQDDLVKAISEDLLRSPHTSTNVVSNKMVKDYFIEHRDGYYWD